MVAEHKVAPDPACAILPFFCCCHGGVHLDRGAVPAGSKQRLNPRWMKLNDFNGNQSEWSDWAFGFKRAIRGADLEVFEIMEKVERANSDFEEDELNQFAENGDVSKISGELYDLLCTVVKDEAMTVVRSEDEFRGFRAW